MKEKSLLDKYINNYKVLKDNGFNLVAEAVAYPPDLELIKVYKLILKENGIDLITAPFIGKYDDVNYPKAYTKNDIDTWGFEEERIDYHYQKGELCNAGYSAGVIYSSGDVYPCFQIKEKLGNIYEGINFYDSYKECPAKFCGCPLNKYDPYLFNQKK